MNCITISIEEPLTEPVQWVFDTYRVSYERGNRMFRFKIPDGPEHSFRQVRYEVAERWPEHYGNTPDWPCLWLVPALLDLVGAA